MKQETYIVPAAERALALLESLAASPRGLLLHELADRHGIPRPSCLRLLSTLSQRGYVRQDERNKAFVLTGKVADLGAQHLKGYDLRAAARPILEEVLHETGEIVELVIRDGDHSLVLDRLDPPESACVTAGIGTRMPLPQQHPGRAIFAALSTEERQKILVACRDFVTDPGAMLPLQTLESEVERIRGRGFASGTALKRPEITRVAVAIPDVAGAPTAAIGIAGPTSRLAGSEQRLGALLINYARRLSKGATE